MTRVVYALAMSEAKAAPSSADQVPATEPPAENAPAPVDFDTPQLTLKAALTGVILGGLLSICNVYTGLKIGWGLNMSITGILLALAFWTVINKLSIGRIRSLNRLENNVNQSAVSAAGAVSSAGLVSAIPALEMMEGTRLVWWQLSLWVAVVCFVGIAVAMGLRRQMIIRDKLPFPGGLSCAATLREVYSHGSEALKRVGMLGAGAIAGATLKLLEILKLNTGRTFGLQINGSPASVYSFQLDPTLLMVAVGGLIGFRGCWSLLLGAILSWGVLGSWLVNNNYVPSASRVPISTWLLWPGVALMVVSSLVSFSFSAPAILRAFRSGGKATEAYPTADAPRGTASAPADTGEVRRNWFLFSLATALVLCVVLQVWFFDIRWWAAIIAVLLSFALAVVACRVSGETNVTPVGPMGKITQLVFAGLMPSSAAANLMSAGVTAGAASQCADLMHDLKCGYLLGGIARKQVIAQILGATAGAAVGSLFYLVLIPDPKTMLGTAEWPAVAVMQWKAVAEVFRDGISSLPKGAAQAMLIAAAVGVLLPLLEQFSSKKAKAFIPSPSAFGLAFVIPASNSISMFIGGCIALAAAKLVPNWSQRFWVTLCAGVIAGESLTGAGDALRLVISGLGAKAAAE